MPWHSYKHAAALQAAQAAARIEAIADPWAFLAWALRLEPEADAAR